MQSLSNQNAGNSLTQLNQTTYPGIVPDYSGLANLARNKIIGWYKDVISDIFISSKRPLVFPISQKLIEDYVGSEYEFHYHPFRKPRNSNLEGYHEVKGNVVHVFYNTLHFNPAYLVPYYSRKRARTTQVHELGHFLQGLDPSLCYFLSDLQRRGLPQVIVRRINEQATNKAAAMFLMPNYYFMEQFKIAKGDVNQLARFFDVTVSTVKVRVSELEILYPQYAREIITF